MDNNLEILPQLLELLYGGLACPEQWRDFLSELCRHIMCHGAVSFQTSFNVLSPAVRSYSFVVRGDLRCDGLGILNCAAIFEICRDARSAEGVADCRRAQFHLATTPVIPENSIGVEIIELAGAGFSGHSPIFIDGKNR